MLLATKNKYTWITPTTRDKVADNIIFSLAVHIPDGVETLNAKVLLDDESETSNSLILFCITSPTIILTTANVP